MKWVYPMCQQTNKSSIFTKMDTKSVFAELLPIKDDKMSRVKIDKVKE